MTSLPGIDPVVDASGRGKVLRSLFRLYFGADRLRWCEQLNGATECVVLEEPTVVYPYIIEPTPISMALRELLECDRGDDLRPHDGDRFPYKGYVGWLFS